VAEKYVVDNVWETQDQNPSKTEWKEGKGKMGRDQ